MDGLIGLIGLIGLMDGVIQCMCHSHTQASSSARHRALKGLWLVSMPALFFFAFLYYTDIGGALAVLGMLHYSYSKQLALSALVCHATSSTAVD
jgi:hypothetical protein